MPLAAPIHPLTHKLIDFIVERIDKYYNCYYYKRVTCSYDKRPTEGPFGEIPSLIVLKIIDKLVRKRKLHLKYLFVLLPHDPYATELTCVESKGLTAYQPHLLHLILTRATFLQKIHYHTFKGADYYQDMNINIMNISMKHIFCLKELNFENSRIEDVTLSVIASYCDSLKILILNNTDITDLGFKYLVKDDCIFKFSLRKLEVAYTRISAEFVAKIHLKLPNLEHFLSDASIFASIKLLETQLRSYPMHGEPVKSNFRILKGSFSPYVVSFRSVEILRGFEFVFSNVHHLILTNIKKTDTSAINLIIPHLGKLNILNLSAKIDEMNVCPFSMLRTSFDACGRKLICLKIEKFSNVDVYHLGAKCPILKRLILINNTYHNIKSFKKLDLFEKLIELKVMLLSDYEKDVHDVNLSQNSFFFMLHSSYLKRLLVIRQEYFSDALIRELISRGYLQNLEEIHVYECNYISSDSIWRFVMFERIRVIEIDLTISITETFSEDISNYIKDNNYNVSFSIVNKLPNRIKLLVTDLPLHGKKKQYFADKDYGIDVLYS